MRIASLLASGTEIAWALGLGDSIVAISHECDYPAETLDRPRITRPRFGPSGLDSGELDAAVRQAMVTAGSVYEIDDSAMREVQPDLVLTQAVCDVCAVPASDAHGAVAKLDWLFGIPCLTIGSEQRIEAKPPITFGEEPATNHLSHLLGVLALKGNQQTQHIFFVPIHRIVLLRAVLVRHDRPQRIVFVG